MGTITSSNAGIAISVPKVFPIPQLLQGFAADDAFAHESFEMTETRMGVDGILSAGYTPNPKKWRVIFQPDSPSILVFDNWGLAMESAKEAYPASMVITLTSINKAYQFKVGWLRGFKKLPDAKKVLEPQEYEIEWQSITPVPIPATT